MVSFWGIQQGVPVSTKNLFVDNFYYTSSKYYIHLKSNSFTIGEVMPKVKSWEVSDSFWNVVEPLIPPPHIFKTEVFISF